MDGRATAPAAGTVLNALATGFGSAFAIDATTTATVELDRDGSGEITGAVAGNPEADTRLVERCVELVTDRYGDGEGGHVRTESEIPMAAGLKSSSAAANATVGATLAALDLDLAPPGELDIDTDPVDDAVADPDGCLESDAAADPTQGEASVAGNRTVDRTEAARIGVEAARDVGVTVTGAFDDASASMLGGVTVTDNTADTVVARDPVDWDVLVWVPPERAYSADADVERCERIAPLADLVLELALDGEYATAMTVNGFAFCAALGFSADPLVEALPGAEGVSLSGTGPSVVAVGQRDALERVRDTWDNREGDTWLTTTRTTGTRTT